MSFYKWLPLARRPRETGSVLDPFQCYKDKVITEDLLSLLKKHLSAEEELQVSLVEDQFCQTGKFSFTRLILLNLLLFCVLHNLLTV